MPLWIWGVLIGYLSVLVLAALWAGVERTRWAMVERRGKLPARLSDEGGGYRMSPPSAFGPLQASAASAAEPTARGRLPLKK